jgi:single-strand DNA-binding protein
VVGRVQNNNYERDGETVYTMAFTAEEIDYLDTKAEGEALRGAGATGTPAEPPSEGASAAKARSSTSRSRKPSAKTPAAADTDDIPF